MLLDQKKLFFYYFFILICLSAVLFSNPFLRYPYDMIHHLIVIDDIYAALTTSTEKLVGIWSNNIYIMIPTGEYEEVALSRARYIWHYAWATVFNIAGIDSAQMILRAKIIHIVQIYLTLFSIYFFSKVAIRNVFKTIDALTLKWLSLWSVIIWLSIFATFSGAYHQVWIMWYSVNYQITLPLFWHITALTLVLLLEDTSWKKKLFFIVQIIIISRFMLQAHSMEFMYYLMHVFIFSLVFIDKLIFLFKKYIYLLLPIVFTVWYFMKNYQTENSAIFNYLSLEKLPELYEKILREGNILLHGYNRASGTVNELMYFIGLLSIVALSHILWRTLKNDTQVIHTRILIYLTLTSLFVLIPLYQFSGGLFAVITKTMVVNRLYYSSSLFILLPIMIYYIINTYGLRLKTINIVLALILFCVAIFSKHNDTLNHNYYKNIQSIKYSFIERRIGFNLSKKQIAIIGKILNMYESNRKDEREIFYYARADIAFVIKYIYKKNVYWKGRRVNPDFKKHYEESKHNPDYKHILFEIPKNFPEYRPYS